jgi:hypothetical protein
MGNLVQVAEGEAAPSGMDAVHGVVHRLWCTGIERIELQSLSFIELQESFRSFILLHFASFSAGPPTCPS